MLTLDNVTDFLLDRCLIDSDWIMDGRLTIRGMARRNRNLMILGPGTSGFLIKQPFDSTEGGHETLRREALFHQFCREDPAAAPVARVIPRLLDSDLKEAILVFELIPGVATLLSKLEPPCSWDGLTEAARRFGQTLGIYAERVRSIDLDDPRLSWLPSALPAAMDLNRPKATRRGALSRAYCEILHQIQKIEIIVDFLYELSDLWQSKALIHGDMKFDNVLVSYGPEWPACDAIQVWIADWELVQAGDPAWDFAGALQDLLVTWVRSMPLKERLDLTDLMGRANLPLTVVRDVARALWSGYRDEAGLHPDEADDFLLRAVKFSAARLLYTACEWSWYEDRVPRVVAILLEIAENLILEPERGQILLYGITPGQPTP